MTPAELYDEAEQTGDEDADDDALCRDCHGTGIGHGPPDVSRCGCCGGSGLRKRERDPDDWADEKRDREWDDRNEPRPAVDRGVDW